MRKTNRVGRRRRATKTRRVSRRKTQYGGNFVELRQRLREHEYLKNIGPNKPVATPDSGPEVTQFINLWEGLNPEEKNKLANRVYPRVYNFHLGVEVTPDSPEVGNRIIFYSQEHLDLLAQSAEMTRQELLDILKTRLVHIRTNEDEYKKDLIKIAFNSPDFEGPLQTERGQIVKATYRSLIDQ